MRFLIANGAMAIELSYLLSQWDNWAQWDWNVRISYLGVICVAGLLTYAVIFLLAGGRVKDFRIKHSGGEHKHSGGK